MSRDLERAELAANWAANSMPWWVKVARANVHLDELEQAIRSLSSLGPDVR